MRRLLRLNFRRSPVAWVIALAGAALSVLLAGRGTVLSLGGSFDTAMRDGAVRRPTGQPQLVSIEPLPQSLSQSLSMMDGEMCQWMPASSSEGLVAALRQARPALLSQGVGGPAARAASAAAADGHTSLALERPPVRTIRDSFPTYSAVAVDVRNNEIVLQDENLFQIMVYDRMANTPPAATMTEPKRVISGPLTKSEFNCGLYIDPQTGDIYSVNNDTLDTLVIFSRNARGNVRPDRELHTPHRTYGIAVEEAKEELFLTVQDPPMVVVYHKYAKGEEKPVRVLRGNRTGLADAHGLGLDTKNGWMFVANYGSAAAYADEGGNAVGTGTSLATEGTAMVPGSGRYYPPSITVYPIQASGNTAPLRTISGPNTTLNWPAHIYVDEEQGEVFVANDGDNSIVVFRVTDSGDVAPTRVLKGPRTLIQNPTGIFVDTVHNELVVANMGSHSATVYPRAAQGNTPPLRTIRSGPLGQPALMIGNPGSVAYDTKRNEIIAPN